MTAGAKFRIDGDPRGDEPVGHVLGRRRRGGDDADGDRAARGRSSGRSSIVADREVAEAASPTLAGSASTSAATGKPAVAEPAVVGEGLPEVADADDDDRPVLGEAELAAHLEQQVLDVVADAPGAVGAEVREVLADLGGVDAGQLGQPLRRDRASSCRSPARAGCAGRPAGAPRSPPGCAAIPRACAPSHWDRLRRSAFGIRCSSRGARLRWRSAAVPDLASSSTSDRTAIRSPQPDRHGWSLRSRSRVHKARSPSLP